MKKYLLIGTFILFISCASLPEQIQRQVVEKDFPKALQTLDKKGVGSHVKKDLDREATKAREIYAEGLYNHYNTKIQEQVSLGNARNAFRISLESKSLCPWSPRIKKLVAERESVITHLNQIQSKWKAIELDKVISDADSRKIIEDIKPVYGQIQDSAFLVEILYKATTEQLDTWSKIISDHGNYLDPSLISSFENLLMSLPNVRDDKRDFLSAVKSFSLLPNYKDPDINQINNFGIQESELLAQLISYFKTDHEYQYLIGCHKSLEKSFRKWCQNELSAFLKDSRVSFELINNAESIVHRVGFINKEMLLPSLAKAHFIRAQKRAKDGKAALMSLLHLQRCQEYHFSIDEISLKKVQDQALASFSAGKPIETSIGMSADPSVNPVLYALLRVMFGTELYSRTKDYFNWKWSNLFNKDLMVHIKFRQIDLFETSYDDLESISSTYLSHYEDVPNPMKEYYKSLLSKII
ncbi:MAG: hypothetical protein JRI72_09960 [Deltaproteobacteria bacterium]|nr:hypothetical protein [Deltaproteobacteria bacterium]